MWFVVSFTFEVDDNVEIKTVTCNLQNKFMETLLADGTFLSSKTLKYYIRIYFLKNIYLQLTACNFNPPFPITSRL